MSVDDGISLDHDNGDYVEQEASVLQPLFMVLPEVLPSRMQFARLLSYGAFKRGFDATVSLAMLVLLSPLFLILAIVIKIDSPGPVFFRQTRTGKNGKEFKILKFRSMVVDNNIHDLSCEDKTTRIGEKLRKTSIDELPQLINVLKGEMAFIGPRPWIPEYYKYMNDFERRRYDVRPGITGLAAAKGRNGLSVFEKIFYDLEYVNNYSLHEDVKVILLTIGQLFRREEAQAGKMKVYDDIKDLKKKNAKLKTGINTF